MNITLTVPKKPNSKLISYDELENAAPEGVYTDADNADIRYLVFEGSGTRSLLYLSPDEMRLSWGFSFTGKLRSELRFQRVSETVKVSFSNDLSKL